jgi:hypothetical protein
VQPHDQFPLRYDPKNPARNSSDPLPSWMYWYEVVFCGGLVMLFVWMWLKR